MKLYPPPGQLGPRAISEWGLRTAAAGVRVEGLEHIPSSGPVLLVARHFHHLLDGAVLVTRVPRPVHIVVGLDWATTRQRRVMEWMCRAAEYPVVLRRDTLTSSGAFRSAELLHYTRAALGATTTLLRAGRVVVVFPEGYPNIDPTGSRKPSADAWLPFEAGFLKMLALAERDKRTNVALVPVGFQYEPGQRWTITARFGRPLRRDQRRLDEVEGAVRHLCTPAKVSISPADRSRATATGQ